jgi:Flp pilus assembly protein TadD
VVPSHIPQEQQTAQLSPESEAILHHIPANLEPKKTEKAPPPISIDRATPTPALPPDTSVKTHEGLGVKIEVKQPNPDTNIQLEKAYDAAMAGKMPEAIGIYQDVLAHEPNNKLALFGLATTYQKSGQINLARPLYGKLLTLDPRNPEALNNFLALVGEESPREAVDELAQVEKANPDFSPVPAQMALNYERLGKMDLAIMKMERATALSPENLLYRYNLAVLYDKTGQAEKASVLYRQMLSAYEKGEKIPGDPQKIRERLTFLGSNRP